ncbi:hypothetical protein HPULCUR_011249 [Helicostylum pulchrum]|uniref:G-patch domain-containing protein n=1 Tax=Helicostylum pulchrum TaxID=562976 RepID=A0ABP9YFI8_9FUNG
MSRLPLQSKAIRPKFENKRAIFGDEDEDEENKANDELVLGFEDNKVKEAEPKKEAAPLSIAPQPNLDWRALAKGKKELYVPARAQQPTTETRPEVLAQSSTSFGLQIQKKTVIEDTVVEDTVVEDTVMTESSTVVQQESVTEEKVTKTLEERAIEALIKESLGEGVDDENNGPKKVIPADSVLSFKDDVENRPDETGMDAYEKIPVDEFGAALLRGLGWNEGEGIGRNRKNAPAAPLAIVKQRDALLGLGAKPEQVDKDHKSKNRRAAYEYKDTSLFKKISKRKDDDRSSSKRSRDDDRSSSKRSRDDDRSSSKRSRDDDRSSSRH